MFALAVTVLLLLERRPAVPPDLVPYFPISVFFDVLSAAVWLRVDLEGPPFALAAVSAACNWSFSVRDESGQSLMRCFSPLSFHRPYGKSGVGGLFLFTDPVLWLTLPWDGELLPFLLP